MIRKCKRCGKERFLKTDCSYASEYCRNCQSKVQKETKLKKHLCLTCGKKTKVLKCPHCNKVVKYYQRCEKCSKENNSPLSSSNKVLNSLSSNK